MSEEHKFEFPAEILPDNERTAKIMKERQEKEAAEKEPLIYNKQWYFYTQFEPETILRDDIDEVILGCYNVGKPIQLYFNDLIK